MPKRKDKTQSPEERLQEMLVPESEQPYPVPENWCWTTIDAINQYQGMSLNPRENPDKKYELYSVPSLDNNFPEIVLGKNIGSTKQLVQKGDVLLCKINPRLNRVWQVHAYTSDDLLASSEWIVVRNHNLNAGYLRFYFQSSSFRKYMLSNVSGVGGSLMRAKPKYVGTYPIPIPPLPEQQRIVDRIESLFSKLDAAKTKAQAVIDSHESRKAAILHKAFTGELTKKWREENNISFEDWSFQPLKDCGTWSGGGTPSISHPEYWDDGDIPWVTSKDMKSDVIAQTQICTNQLGIENSSAIYSEKPAVLFVTRSGILRRTLPIAVIERPFTVNQDLKVLTPTDISVRYLFWACKSAEKKILSTCMKSGTTVESINFDRLKEFSIPVAPKEEQKAIVKTLEQLIRRENQATDAAGKIILQIDAMKKYILNRAFRGELGTNDPREESAVGLLMQDIEEK